MRRPEQIRILKELLGHIDAGSNVDAGGIRYNPASSYTSPELADREWQEFFRSARPCGSVGLVEARLWLGQLPIQSQAQIRLRTKKKKG